ncbi:hypothetical protein K469DRAFT_674827 [Zopfia rhizophila CBS 207.26]|uniref:Rhodopsin domain-containing protein n=1 Tax=Zopfia rhizophila CBS 207.26 TaxID=1314779 RepID=A0A6A6DJM4_9PEZI|nr:hypothetical protein K469DRAFT_674827 [Zopfia rhizophila CBS 207.26]
MAEHPTPPTHSPEYLAEDSGPTLVAIGALFICLDTIFVALRFYARRLNKSPIGLDDLVIPFAWLVNVGLCILGITMVYDAGVGRHLAYVVKHDRTKLVSWAKSLYALEWLYLPAVAFPKISILLLYLRIFTDRTARLVAHILIYVLLANWFAYLIASSLQCTPFEYQWNKNIKGGHCFNQQIFYKTVSAPNIATDLVVLLLPIKTLLELQTSLPRKIGIFIVFLAGSVGIVASCIRMAAFYQTEAFVDNTYASVKLVGWSIIEPGMYLVAACSMKFRPVFTRISRKLHLWEFYGTFTRGESSGGRNSKSMRLDMMPSSNSGFNKMHAGKDENSSTVDIVERTGPPTSSIDDT